MNPIVVQGEPVSKSRAKLRILPNGRVTSYTPSGTVAAEREIALLAQAAGYRPKGGVDFAVRVEFRMASWQRRDLDNLLKLVMDALTGIVWADDSQVRFLMATLERGVEPSTAGSRIELRELPAQRRGAPCVRCGKWIEASPSSRRKFCSKSCQGEARTAARPARDTRGSGEPPGRPLLAERTPTRDYERDRKARRRIGLPSPRTGRVPR